ncbi:hypothetical protein [Achromobacter phage ewik_TL4]|nr:hypothetical protein [Achromobacter phage ewik_TL4]
MVRQSITGPIAGALGSALGGWLGGGSSVNVVGNGIGNGMSASQWGGSFANGGNFRVQGSGGVDSQMVSFMATPGEEVYIRGPGEGMNGGGGGATVFMPITINNNASDKVQVRAEQQQDEAGNMSTTLTIDMLENELAARMGSGRGPLHRSTLRAVGATAVPQ